MEDKAISIPKQSPLNPFASNIPKYFGYTALKGFGFGAFAAVWVIYLQQQRGLSLSQAALIDVTFFVAAAFSEIPTGIVADTLGRKKSLVIGAALLSVGVLGWTFAPTLPLIMLAYIAMGIGLTFLSGAEDAFFYESIQLIGRGDDYTRLVGRAGATFLGALALGSVASGLLASLALILPFLVSSLGLILMLGLVLTFKEPRALEKSDNPARKSYQQVLRYSLALIRTRPGLRYGILYLALVPLASLMLEALFLQPQALSLGVPIAGVGVIVMAAQLTSMVGSTLSDRVKTRFGEGRLLFTTPLIIIFSLLGLAVFQILPALLFVLVIGFFSAVIRPIMLSRIQEDVSDDIRATVLSLQSLMFTIVAAISQPILGLVADQAGLPATYFGLAFSLSLVFLFFWVYGKVSSSRALLYKGNLVEQKS